MTLTPWGLGINPTPGALASHSSLRHLSVQSFFNRREMLKLGVYLIFLWCLLVSPGLWCKQDPWGRPGCHRVGHTRKVRIPDCVEFEVTTNACRGYCESWAVPSPPETILSNPRQAITSVGQCCNIIETEDVEVRVLCLDGMKDLVFKSAKSCSCYHCKKE